MRPPLSRCDTTPEPLRNQLGTTLLATGSGEGNTPLKGVSPPAEPPTGTAATETIGGVLILLAAAALYAKRSRVEVKARNPYGLTDAELLDCLGPSWSAMTLDEQDAYGPDHPPRRRVA